MIFTIAKMSLCCQKILSQSNINEKFYEMETRQIAMLNEIFGEVELTKGEMRTLVWLVGWEESTVANVVSAIRKAIAAEARRLGQPLRP